MPYRLTLRGVRDTALDRLIALGALDVESPDDGAIVALMPDSVAPGGVARVLDAAGFEVSEAVGRDAGSVWVLTPRASRIGRLQIVPAHVDAPAEALRLVDAAAFGTGLHPTTALCLEALDDAVRVAEPDAVLDVGTGSGVLALAALALGVPRAVGLDIDDGALRVAAENARLNGFAHRLRLVRGGPEVLRGTWPIVVANILPAPLVEMAPALVSRVGHRGRLVLSGIAASVERDVARAYGRFGMHGVRVRSRAGWIVLELGASW